MRKTVLITGGLGFIGSSLVPYLLKNTEYNIIILDKGTYASNRDFLPKNQKLKNRLKIIKGDVTKKRIVEDLVKKSSMVIHLAAETNVSRSVLQPHSSIFTNVIGTSMLLEASAKYSVERFIFISSSEVYGDQKDNLPMDENHPLNPITPYAVSKLAGDKLAYSFFLTKKLPVIILRLFNAYGPWQHTEKMVPLFITNLMKNLPITLYHGGKQKRDWVYVDDHVRAIKLVLQHPIRNIAGEVFNIGTGSSTSVETIAKKILKELKKDSSLIKVVYSSQNATMGNVGISEKAQKILNWKSALSLEEGIAKTVKWYINNRRWWEKRKSE